MTLIEQIKTALLLAIVAVVGFGIWQSIELRAKNRELSEAVSSLQSAQKADRAASAVHNKALDDIRVKQRDQDRKVQDALQANPSWADAPVPDAVWNSLFPASGATASP